MSNILLAVLFVVNNDLTILDGFAPRIQPSIDVCMKRAKNLQIYLDSVSDLNYKYTIICDNKDNIQKYINKYNDSTGL